MATVTAEIERLLKAKDRQLAGGAETMRGMLAEIKTQVVDELSRVRGGSYTALHLKSNLASIERYLQGFATAGSSEMNRILDAAWESGADLVPAALRAGGIGVAFGHIPGPLLVTLKEFSYHKIGGVAGDAFTKIRGELSLGILGQKTPDQVIDAIAGTLTSKGVFDSIEERAMVIAKTEMGRAYSTATQEGMGQASASVPELQKQWWHAGHPARPRRSHLALHGQIRPVNEHFVTGTLSIDYPRAPSAPASEVIRCGCDHVPYHPAWGKETLPIYNERGKVIARRGPWTGEEEDLSGKFILGQKRPPAGVDLSQPVTVQEGQQGQGHKIRPRKG